MKPGGVISQQIKPHLFPHDNVEALTGLVGEHNACVVVISVGVHVKCHTEVYCAELVISCLNKGISVLWANNFHYTCYGLSILFIVNLT